MRSSSKRSSTKPITKADKQLSIRHLKDSIKYNQRHIRDHKVAESHGGSKKYNEDHIKGHEKAMKKDKKLLEKRMEKKERPSVAKAKKMLKDNSAQGHPLTDKQKKYFGFIAGGGKPTKQRKSISLPKKELVSEHTKLVQTLRHGMKQQLSKEASKQAEELSEYKKKRYIQTVPTPRERSVKKLIRGMKGYKR